MSHPKSSASILAGVCAFTLTCGGALAGKVYWCASNHANPVTPTKALICRTEADGTSLEVLQEYTWKVVRHIEVDPANGKVYWFQEETLFRSDLDGQSVETLATFPAGFLAGAVDLASGKVYGHAAYNLIVRANLDGTGYGLLTTTLNSSWSPVLDLNANKIYWGGWNYDETLVIWRANLSDGTNDEVVIQGYYPNALAIDSITNKLYWLDCPDGGRIYRSDLDGANIELVIDGLQLRTDGSKGGDLLVDSVNGKLYWSGTSTTTGLYVVRRANLDGSQIEDINPLIGSALSIDSQHGRLYGGARDLRSANLDGSDLKANLGRITVKPVGIAVDSINANVYWIDVALGTIQRCDLTGANPQVVVDDPGVIPPHTSLLQSTRSVALDVSAGKMYWTSATSIRRANLDGSSAEEVLQTAPYQPIGISLDLDAGKLIWTEQNQPGLGAGRVRQANLDGSNVEGLVDDIVGPTGVAQHSPTGRIFWADSGMTYYNKVSRAVLPGGSIEDIIPIGLYPPTLSLAIDSSADQLYIANGPRITRTGLDGLNSRQIAAIAGFNITGIALDPPLCTPVYRFGDVDFSGGLVDLDDILCVVRAFGNASLCSNADLMPCTPDGVISIDDLLAVGNAFSGAAATCSDRCAP